MSDAAISNEESPHRVDEKGVEKDNISPNETSDVSHGDMENGHLKELEVDVSKVLGEEGIEDIDGDDSPYPEGIFSPHFPTTSLSIVTLVAIKQNLMCTFHSSYWLGNSRTLRAVVAHVS